MDAYFKVIAWLKERGISLNSREQVLLCSRTAVRFLKAKEIVMAQDQKVEKFYFLNSGIVRLYRDYEGSNHTLGLIDSNDFLAAPQMIMSGEISTCSLETLTEAAVLEWNAEDILFIKERIGSVYTIELAIMTRLLNWVQQNQIELVCLSAEERYKLLLERQPDVLLRIPLKYVASFLGIHTDSLSRIRKKIS